MREVQLNIDHLSDVDSKDGWDDLCYFRQPQRMIQAMMATHSNRTGEKQKVDNAEVDLVSGKGRGSERMAP